ncbi:LytR/AlgR family response regulator transcription factor [Chryseobacterium tongliaoense]|uniref:LytR/AlgR family response regulator transcription factor n=1 Tax=Chryseobacterium tongliaoense TaxID=3240933 RepID=UPI00351976E8
MINCIIVDDEPLAIALLENHLSKIDGLKLIGKAGNAMEAYKILQTKTIDLMFLDIQMPNLNGIDFLKSLTKKPKTIFTTAYRDFAVEGFELEAMDYLLKPITFKRFFTSIDRILRNVPTEYTEDFIIVKSQGLQHKISLTEIAYFESLGNDIKIVLHENKSFILKTTMNDLELILSDKGFIRIHRSFIINSKWVTAFNNNEVLLGHHQIPVGRSYKNEFDIFITTTSQNRLF